MYTINAKQNGCYFIVYKDDVEFIRVSKKNKLETVLSMLKGESFEVIQ